MIYLPLCLIFNDFLISVITFLRPYAVFWLNKKETVHLECASVMNDNLQGSRDKIAQKVWLPKKKRKIVRFFFSLHFIFSCRNSQNNWMHLECQSTTSKVRQGD